MLKSATLDELLPARLDEEHLALFHGAPRCAVCLSPVQGFVVRGET
jgi:hypothetical protein